MKTPDLGRMKWIAAALLGAALVLYIVASMLRAMHPAWGYVAAFSEAAMVGAIADWFAVVALFRHPLGLPIPHTAIIPSNKDRIGQNLANFICANFLSTEQVLRKLAHFDAGSRLAAWLSQHRHAEQVTAHLSSALQYALGALDDERVRHFFRTTVLDHLARADVSKLAGQWLGLLTADRRHQAVLDSLLRKLSSVLNDAGLQESVAEAIASEVKYLRFVGLDNVAGRYATSKMVAGIIRLVGEMADDPEHPLRLQFDEFVADFVTRLQADEDLRAKVESIKHDLLDNPALSAYLQEVWGQLIASMRTDLARENSTIRSRVLLAVQTVADKLAADPAMQSWINEQLMTAAPRWIERYREDIRLYIIARVGDWNAQEMTDELERNIGRDLQFIRINGTLVGGLVGLAIHAATQMVSRP